MTSTPLPLCAREEAKPKLLEVALALAPRAAAAAPPEEGSR